MKIIEMENGFEVRTNRGKLSREYKIEPRDYIFRKTNYNRNSGGVTFFPNLEDCLSAFVVSHLTEMVECKTIYA